MLSKLQKEKLAEAYNIERLSDMLPLIKAFIKKDVTAVNHLAIKIAMGVLNAEKTYKKAELMLICFSIFDNKELFLSFVASQPKWFGEILELLLWKKEMHRSEIERIIKQSAFTLKNNSYLVIHDELKFFGYDSRNSYHSTWGFTKAELAKSMMLTIHLGTSLKEILVDFYPKPKNYYFNPVLKLPASKSRLIFNAEVDILSELRLLLGYYQQDNIKYSEKGKPNAPSIKKTQRTLMIKEFYPDLMPFQNIRTMLLSGMIHTKYPKNATATTPDTIKTIFTSLFAEEKSRYSRSICSFIFNQLKGINSLSYEFDNGTILSFWDAIQNTNDQNWITFENLLEYGETHYINFCPLTSYEYSRLTYEDDTKTKWETTTRLNKQDGKDFLEIPFLKACVFIFASFGLVEVAYNVVDIEKYGTTWFSEYDGLEAFRFTDLGWYVLGKSDKYETPEFENANKIIFDAENLIIRAEGNVALLGNLLSNYVEKISNNRFAFRPSLFLNDCKDVKEIKAKIANFKATLNTQLPPFWDAEFEKIIDNANAVQIQNEHLVFQLRLGDKNVLRAIAQDEILKKMVIKAENFCIIVDKKNITAFKKRMRELDYFIEV